MEDIKECVTDAQEGIDMPTKVSTERHDDDADKAAATKYLKQKFLRKEIKNAKERVVIVSKCCPKMLIMEADTT